MRNSIDFGLVLVRNDTRSLRPFTKGMSRFSIDFAFLLFLFEFHKTR